ncbi:putative disease resistance protein [Cucumis melo var. makuwa]|uniref:Putative disease resistance protein n=1 Tax=Cucumis melo var. makuwa TaxID=1194695 RepID=A0A5D3C231_CUCMM|nr:putative disease resistance protein [Cucumis melo var. makuwa]
MVEFFFMCKFGSNFHEPFNPNLGFFVAKLAGEFHRLLQPFEWQSNRVCEIVSLQKLSITDWDELSFLPEDVGKLINLKNLRLRSCIHLEALPESTTKLWELVLLVLDISVSVLPSFPRRLVNCIRKARHALLEFPQAAIVDQIPELVEAFM